MDASPESRLLLLFPDDIPGRVLNITRNRCAVSTGSGTLRCIVPPGLVSHEGSALAVGDWVAVDAAKVVRGVLPRTSRLSRKAAGRESTEQIIAANVDFVFIVQGLDHDFNLRRLERYLVMIHQSGAAPVIVLTKSDTTPHGQTMKEKAEAAAPGTPVFLVNALSGEGLAPLTELLGPGKTGVLVGSSGAGKSTLINALLGNGSQKTQAVRAADSRGRHTTTARQMFFLPNGGSIIDNPGMRELALWTTTSSVDEVFPDIETYAGHCRFRDCAHEMEPGCAVRRAVEQGDLSEERLASYHKLLRESQHLDLREDPLGALREKGKEKALHRAIRSVTKTKRHYRDGFE